MRISDWSSDVCSSDLLGLPTPDIVIEDDTDLIARKELEKARQMPMIKPVFKKAGNARFRPEEIQRGLSTHRAETVKHAIVGIGAVDGMVPLHDQIGRASCRERVCQLEEIMGRDDSIKKNR